MGEGGVKAEAEICGEKLKRLGRNASEAGRKGRRKGGRTPPGGMEGIG